MFAFVTTWSIGALIRGVLAVFGFQNVSGGDASAMSLANGLIKLPVRSMLFPESATAATEPFMKTTEVFFRNERLDTRVQVAQLRPLHKTGYGSSAIPFRTAVESIIY